MKKFPSYGIIKKNLRRGILCLGSTDKKKYKKVKRAKNDIEKIGEKYGFTYEQIHNFISRYNTQQRKPAAGIAIRKKGKPPKDCVGSEEDKAAELRFILARRKEVRTNIKYMVLYRHKDKYRISEMCRFFEVTRSS